MKEKTKFAYLGVIVGLLIVIAVLGLSNVSLSAQAASSDTLASSSADTLSSSSAYPSMGCRVIKGPTQTLSNGGVTALTFDVQANDTTPGDDCWTASNPTRLYARENGYYLAGGAVTLGGSQNLSGIRRMTLIVRKNGGTWIQAQTAHTHAVDDSIHSVTTGMFEMNVGDYIELVVYNALGTTVSTYPGPCEHCVNGWLMKAGD